MIKLSLSKEEDLINLKLEEIILITDLNYENLYNIPKINDVELIGNKSFEDLGLIEITPLEIATWWSRI